MLSTTVYYFFQIVFIILVIYCLLTWIPNINWYNEPFRSIRAFAEIFFAPFRKIIPPINGVIDISPIIAFIALSLITNFIIYILNIFHL